MVQGMCKSDKTCGVLPPALRFNWWRNCGLCLGCHCLCPRSLSALPAGEQLTISYVELAATRQERRRQLLQQYFFDIDAATAAGSASNSAAAECTAGGACVKQLLTQQVPEAVQQLGAKQLGWRSSSSSSSADAPNYTSSPAVLLSYPNNSNPPWPVDNPDKQLCQMHLLLLSAGSKDSGSLGNASSGSSSSSLSDKPLLQRLPGGMCVLSQQLSDAEGGSAMAAATAGLFMDWEGLELSAEAEAWVSDLEQDGTDTQQQHLQQQHLHPSGQQQQEQQLPALQRQQQQQQQQLEVVQWGDWSRAAVSSAADDSSGGTSRSSSDLVCDVVVTAAHTVLHIWSLHQQAEQLAAQGYAAPARQLYQQALAVADGASSVPAASATTDTTAGGAAAMPSVSSGCSRFVLGPKHILRARVNAGLLKAAVDEGNCWDVALAAAQALTPVYELVHPKVSAIRIAMTHTTGHDAEQMCG